MTVPGDALLVHGYTLTNIERIARQVVARRLHTGYPRPDAYDIAYGAVAEALYAAEERPSREDLVKAGYRAIEEETRGELKLRGQHSSREGVGQRFRAHWHQRVTHFPDDQIVNRMAVVQILPLLTPRQCEVLVALAASGSQVATAAAMGISIRTVEDHLAAARETFRRWWHEHETPVTHRDLKATCGHGHARAEHEVVWAGKRTCRVCQGVRNRRARRKSREKEQAA